jgi:hypothetical protein
MIFFKNAFNAQKFPRSLSDNIGQSDIGIHISQNVTFPSTLSLKSENLVYQQESFTYGMEWMAAHALQILIVLEILTTSFDMYVKKRQLNKFNETEIPAFYN